MRHLLASRSEYVIGIDEVGMGALAGPIAVGAVVTRVDWSNEHVKDSKKYSDNKLATAHEQRSIVLDTIIKPQALFYCHVKMPSDELDQLGIRGAWERCLWKVATKCLERYPQAVVVVDGDTIGSVPTPNVIALPKADSLVAAVSAASVLAKVERDKVMHLLDEIYPHYGFANHMGYGTQEHMLALSVHGPSPIHRHSYGPIKKAVAWQKTRPQKSATPDSTS